MAIHKLLLFSVSLKFLNGLLTHQTIGITPATTMQLTF